MICKQCGKEFDSKRATAKYCSPKCRKLAFLSVPEVSVPEVSVPEVSVPISVTKMTADDLYHAINCYPGNSWKDSPEFEELMRRLETFSIDELTGYWIPNWKN